MTQASTGSSKADAVEAPDIPAPVLALVGVDGEQQASWDLVEASAVRRFAQAVMDDDPSYWDAEAATGTKFGGVVAPPLYPMNAFRRAPGTRDELADRAKDPDFDGAARGYAPGLPAIEIPWATRLLNGGTEAEFTRNAAVGDRIFAQSCYEDIFTKVGRSGPMVFVIVRTRYSNQDDQTLMTIRRTLILR